MHGLILLDKPAGISSSKALQPLRSRAKVGHAGTLDPFATGLLIALVGDATRLSDLAMQLPKTYRARVRFGRETDTLDTEGTVIAEADPGSAAPPGLDAAVAGMIGTILQVPPVYSALKVDGRRAYRLAREGQSPELAARPVEVHEMLVTAMQWPLVELEVSCGAGTYVRSIARDLGRAVDLPASLEALRRTAIGPFTAADADPERCLDPLLLTDAAGLPRLPLRSVDEALRFVQGRGVPLDSDACDAGSVVFSERLIGLGRVTEEGLTARCVFAAARREIEAETV